MAARPNPGEHTHELYRSAFSIAGSGGGVNPANNLHHILEQHTARHAAARFQPVEQYTLCRTGRGSGSAGNHLDKYAFGKCESSTGPGAGNPDKYNGAFWHLRNTRREGGRQHSPGRRQIPGRFARGVSEHSQNKNPEWAQPRLWREYAGV